MVYPFYIPSIYRHDSEFLILIRDFNPVIKYYIIIAKHQYEDYAKNFPYDNLVILPDTVIKISEIRQYILTLARNNNETHIWMSDDDLSKFFIKTENKKELDEVDFMTLIIKAEYEMKHNTEFKNKNIVQVGFKYSTFALQKTPYSFNTNIGMIQLLDIKQTMNINYDLSFPTLEDTDFTIQLLYNGFNNIQFNHMIFTAPKSGKGKGGLEKEYNNGAKQKGMLKFQEKYQNLINITDLEKGKYKILWTKVK
jgi:hypothetical protein